MKTLLASSLFFAVLFFPSYADAKPLSDNEIREQIIRESISMYSGRCPCPYNTMSNGNRCGGRSAYSKPGVAEPLCYKSDISDVMVRSYRARRGINVIEQDGA